MISTYIHKCICKHTDKRCYLLRAVSLLLVCLFAASSLFSCQDSPASGSNNHQTSNTVTSETSEDTQNSFFAEDSGQTSSGEEIVSSDAVSESPSPYALQISEVMASNKHLFGNTTRDFVEIYSGEETDVLLDGYFLSDDPERPHRHPLRGLTATADGFLVIYLTEEDSMQLSSDGETVYLFAPDGSLLDSLVYTAEIEEGSYTKSGACAYPTPGYTNNLKGYEAYLATQTLPKTLLLSEGMTSNLSYLPQKGEVYDWIELYNGSDQPLLLSSYYLTDKFKEPMRYRLPEITLQPGAYYLIYCSGLTNEGHTPFKLSSSGETVWLTDGTVPIDCLTFPSDLASNSSYGRRVTDGSLSALPGYLSNPTPGSLNTDGILFRVSPPTASLPSGIYSGEVTVELSGSGNIYYTLDGSRPTEKSSLYKEPLHLSENTTIRAFCQNQEGYSAELQSTYLLNLSHTLPIVQISIPDSYIRGESSILENIDQNIEGEGLLSFFVNGSEEFSIPCGFRLHGNDSRKGEKQNFQLRFRAVYGESRLRYPLFEGLPVTEFKSLLLKGGSEDFPVAMMRDELAAAIVSDGMTSLHSQAYRPVILYLNGEYWGVYYLRERLSADYVASYYNVSTESVDLLASYSEVQDGSSAAYDALLRYAQNHDLKNDTEAYNYVLSQIDETSLMDWYICRTFMGDKDYANIRYFRSTEGDGQWRWMFFDLDWAFHHKNEYPLGQLIRNNGRHVLIWNLLKNQAFQDAFIQRYAHLMNTAFATDRILSLIDEIYTAIEPEMQADRVRWNRSYSVWKTCVENLRNYVRDDVRIKHLQANLQSYFSLSDSEMAAYFGGSV